MKPEALKKALARLANAKEQLDLGLKATSHEDFEGHWALFLVSHNSVWSVLEQGCKGHSKASPWFGRKISQRKNDPLLCYLHHARNDNEHGLGEVVSEVPGKILLTTTDPRFSQSFRLRGLELGPNGLVADVTTHDGKPFGVEVTPGHSRLLPVTDRGVTYSPPMEHLGAAIENDSPLAVAGLAIDYLVQLVGEAQTFT